MSIVVNDANATCKDCLQVRSLFSQYPVREIFLLRSQLHISPQEARSLLPSARPAADRVDVHASVSGELGLLDADAIEKSPEALGLVLIIHKTYIRHDDTGAQDRIRIDC